jgi:phosphoribosylaminoimidazole-succinocarboxamide synthase
MTWSKGALLYQGKAKTLYRSNDPGVLLAWFRDDTTAFDGEKKEALARKGIINNHISAFLMEQCEAEGIPTCFKALASDDTQWVDALTMLPLECVVRNRAAGSLCRRYGVDRGRVLDPPLFEFFLKDDALHDPFTTARHALAFGWADEASLNSMEVLSMKIHALLTRLFDQAGLILVDAKYEFGLRDGVVVLADEISPDACRLWDKQTQDSFDKDRFRQDQGDVVGHYEAVAQRLGVTLPS